MYGADVGALNVKVIRKSNFYPDFSTIHPADTPILKYLQVKLIRFTVFFSQRVGFIRSGRAQNFTAGVLLQ